MKKGLFSLLASRRFGPFFFTQFLGAFNDNVFRQALILLIASGAVTAVSVNTLNNVALALFILPFFLFSALAGQVADKYDKASLVRKIKFVEVCIMSAAAVGFFFDAVYFLLGVLFCMGLQSTFFGPIKYSIIPQQLDDKELVSGNALVEMGTFLAILLGSISGVLLKMDGVGDGVVAITVVALALLGYLAARGIPSAPAADDGLKINWNLWKETWHIVGYAREVKSVWMCVLGISWFWFLGAAYTTQLKVYVDDYLLGTDGLYAVLLGTFSIGIGLGSFLCEKLSGKRVELGLVPLGSIGLSVFGVDLFFSYAGLQGNGQVDIAGFLQQAGGYRVLMDLLGIGVFGGFYIVPLFAFIQHRSNPKHLSRIIAANNILNALLMVGSAVAGIVLVGVLELTVPQFFLALALANVLVASYIYTVVPEFLIRLLVWMLTHTMYRVKHHGMEHIPDEGPCMLVCNHVSYVDALLLAGAIRRPVRFVMFKPIYDMPLLNYIFRTGKTIPIDSKTRNPVIYERAFVRIREELEAGEVVCIFPEGKLTEDGEVAEFRAGIEKIVADYPVPVIPMALSGLWGSFFSHKGGKALTRLPSRFWSRIKLAVGDAVAPEQVRADDLRERVMTLRERP
ncbi:MAG: MFS transporter [Alcanivorax sp.]|jgi:1-acyl-sn-glycerol-3-phosphate acyltransferase|uniref:MFS transporter n=1 Tax=Alcanivorax TaxID=59753 RepID=UPI000C63626C|nr:MULTISPECIES: MFS transporter [Alcanivorax]MAC15103.1 MFS transporter [Alcanivorax sp.]MBG32492.1 MFS transporter [Alcanivorax sp.]MDF1639163.1 MFS transporter [Alcanivorax jadensis]|tara:strand:- start:2047 stop:3918 length:1872 start_codon:yes stop_codon:yes gene_type:complete